MKKLLLFVVLVTMFITPSMASERLDEANAKFSYNGKPIHPFLVKELSNWMSNLMNERHPPVRTTVDVAAAFDTYKYKQSTIEAKGNWWFSKHEEVVRDMQEYEAFSYHWLGRMANGIHVVETGANGGGSGFFMDLMFLKFSEGEIAWENKQEKQLLMSIAGIYTLGDRYEGDIKVFPDKVFIPASKRQAGGGSVEKDTELNFPIK